MLNFTQSSSQQEMAIVGAFKLPRNYNLKSWLSAESWHYNITASTAAADFYCPDMVFTFGIMNASMPPLLFLRTDIESIHNHHHHHPSMIVCLCRRRQCNRCLPSVSPSWSWIAPQSQTGIANVSVTLHALTQGHPSVNKSIIYLGSEQTANIS